MIGRLQIQTRDWKGLFPHFLPRMSSLSFEIDLKPRPRVYCLTVPALWIKHFPRLVTRRQIWNLAIFPNSPYCWYWMSLWNWDSNTWTYTSILSQLQSTKRRNMARRSGTSREAIWLGSRPPADDRVHQKHSSDDLSITFAVVQGQCHWFPLISLEFRLSMVMYIHK